MENMEVVQLKFTTVVTSMTHWYKGMMTSFYSDALLVGPR